MSDIPCKRYFMSYVRRIGDVGSGPVYAWGNSIVDGDHPISLINHWNAEIKKEDPEQYYKLVFFAEIPEDAPLALENGCTNEESI